MVSSRLIVHPKNSSSGTIDQFKYYSLMYYNLSNNICLYPIGSISSMWIITFTIPTFFTFYKRQGSDLNFFNPSSRFIVLMYSLNPYHAVFKIHYIHSIISYLSWYVYSSLSAYANTGRIFRWIYSYRVAYKNTISEYMNW